MIKRILFLLLLILVSCEEKKAQKIIPKKTAPKKIVVKKKRITSIKDSLNNKNAQAFFAEYGKQNPETLVEFSTRLGNFTFRLYKDTPIHRANFIFLAKKGYFDTTSFHRLVPNFVAQFGNSDRMSTVNFRNKYKQYKLAPEFRKNRRHKYGALAVARDWTWNPDKLSTPFEFYIVHNKQGAHHLNNEHTVLGEISKGMHIIDKIILEKQDKDEWPFKDIDLKVISIK